jgi:hypothetical protein
MENIIECVVQPQQFGVDIFPAYVFLRRIQGDPSNALMVKKIEGRELGLQEIHNEIEDAYKAEFIDNPGAGGSDDEDGGGPQAGKPIQLGFIGLGKPFGALFNFNCGSFLPDWVCKIKTGYILLFIIMSVIMVLIIRKI